MIISDGNNPTPAKGEDGMKKGNCVTDGVQLIGRVKDVYTDAWTGETLIDIIVYDRGGNRIGRESPSMGGPTSFEPACTASNWKEIKEPNFPLTQWAYIKDSVRYTSNPAGGERG